MASDGKRKLRVVDLGRRSFSVRDQIPTRLVAEPERSAATTRSLGILSRVMLISPGAVLFQGDLPRCTYPLGIGYLAAMLEREGYVVRILDCLVEGYESAVPVDDSGEFVRYGLGAGAIEAEIAAFCPDLVGVSSIFSNQADLVHEICGLAKRVEPRVRTCVGGAHARYFPHMILSDPNVDYVFLGESEFTLVTFCEAVNAGSDLTEVPGIALRVGDNIAVSTDTTLISGPRRNTKGQIAELDVIPFPAFHLYNMERYFQIGAYQSPYTRGQRVAQILTSRGCSAKCTFCTTTNFWGNRLRRRSPDNVVEELALLKSGYGIDEFHVQDDNLTNDMKHAREIIAALGRPGLPWATPQGLALWRLDEDLIDRMAASGAYQLTFAIESGVQRVLEQLIKKPLNLARTTGLIGYARRRGLAVHGFFIVGMPPMFGHPGESIEEMQATYAFAKDAGFTSASFFTATPIVGSELLDESIRQGFIDAQTPLYRMSYKQGLLSVPGLWSGEEVRSLAKDFNKRFNDGVIRETARRQWTQEMY